MPVAVARLILWGGTAALTAFGFSAGKETGKELSGAVKLALAGGAGYLIWKASQK